ncbi:MULTISPECIES: hypothetical protein [Helicobacter]|uniref:Integral membrane protein n=1 Tax=Helicobacter ibis TaxID=2962633 RepID=A0ABT4VED9_9HELI|nr:MULTISPECIES: hypothetical protein [Helicobacter]MDA3966418.1 hypothetical protein [Helicobacter sp. WB40]MDA3968967.1 hypothetical protein [Helicobacter ibis]
MVIALKVIISLAVAMAWYKLTENQEISIAFFVLMLAISFMRPITYQSPTEREEYLEKFRRSKERQLNLENMRREEKKKALEEKKKRIEKEKKE